MTITVLTIVVVSIAVAAFGILLVVAGAKETPDVPASSARVDQGNEPYPRLRAVHSLPEDHYRVDDRPRATLSGKAAKGFQRDRVVMVDQVTRQERQRWMN